MAIISKEAADSIIVTKNSDDDGVHHSKSGKDLIRIPVFVFLYLLGHAEKQSYRSMS